MSNQIQVQCPYCGYKFNTNLPKRMEVPREIDEFPYTRDVGRFDPKSEEERFSPNEWSLIGTDYFSFIGYQWIGILRQVQGAVVMYRVQYCPGCDRMFDLFANYSPKLRLTDIWPHLYMPKQSSQHSIGRYKESSISIRLIRNLEKIVGSATFGTIILGLIVFFMGYSADFYFYKNQPELLLIFALMRGIAALSVILVMTLSNRYVKFMQETKEFLDLFKVLDPRGVNYWINYTLCRFVGAQEIGKRPHITQVDIVAGGLSITSLSFIWALTQYQISGILGFFYCVMAVLISVVFPKILPASWKKIGGWLMLVVLVALGILVLYLINPDHFSITTIFFKVVDLIFWLIVAYFLGTMAWLAMNSVEYIIKGVTRIPMKLSPYDHYRELHPLQVIQRFSTSSMVVIFFTVIAIVSILQIFSQTTMAEVYQVGSLSLSWLLIWLRWVIAIFFAAIAIQVSPRLIVIVALYAGFEFILPETPLSIFLFGLNLIVDFKLIILGLFLTALMVYQISTIRRLLQKLVDAARDEVVDNLSKQIARIQNHINQLSDNLGQGYTFSIYTEYAAALESEKSLISLREMASLNKMKKNLVYSSLIPTVWSLLLPTLWAEILVEPLKKIITP